MITSDAVLKEIDLCRKIRVKSEVRKPLGKRRNLHFNEFQSLLISITGGIGDFIVCLCLSSSSVFFEGHSISASHKRVEWEIFGFKVLKFKEVYANIFAWPIV